MLKVYTDAAVKGNPGRAGIGFTISGNDIYEQIAVPLSGSEWNNHLAEFEAVKQALTWVTNHLGMVQVLFLYSDSKTVVDALHKKFAKDPFFQAYTTDIVSLLNHFPVHIVEWIPEKENKGADNLARQALIKAEKESFD